MKILAILRGVPASGKSTFIKENNLEQYTLCPDDYRIKLGAIEVDETGRQFISKRFDKIAWRNMYEDLESQMKLGKFIIIDATSNKESSFSEYKKLVKLYRYQMVIVDFTKDIEINDEYICMIKERNHNRTPSYKIVPDSVIDYMIDCIKVPLSDLLKKLIISPSEFLEKYKKPNIDSSNINNFGYVDISDYSKVIVVGDIHGCYDALINGLSECNALDDNNIKEDIFYVFLGDYIDRGIQNEQVINFIYDIKNRDNVIILEGNHESHILEWIRANDINVIKARETLKTIRSLPDESVKKLKEIALKCRQSFTFKYDNNYYQVSHAARPYPIDTIKTDVKRIIKGFGDDPYKLCDLTDNNWTEYVKANFTGDMKFISIHGHANVNLVPIHNTEYTYNLCDVVEYGGKLRILEIDKE